VLPAHAGLPAAGVLPHAGGLPAPAGSPAEAGRVPLGMVLDRLGAEGILSVITETGTRLNTALLAAGLVDRVQLFVSPQILGSDAVPAFKGMLHPIKMCAVEVERYENDLGLSSLLWDPWKKQGPGAKG
jgi:diaminohydroxyphosphoribosylaminopyrimidine deaminase / 5-amino-6-(5-phosphoribosylamino)uracil reductase